MGKTYHRASAADRDFLEDQMGKYHEHLGELDVRIGMRMVHAARSETGEIKQPALMHAGHRALALVRLVKARERVFCDQDAIIDIDADEWEEMDDAEKAALVDHELCHLELVRDKEGNIATDDDARPVLRLKPDEIYFTGFYAVLRRHGTASCEYKSLDSIKRLGDQLLFDWALDVDSLRPWRPEDDAEAETEDVNEPEPAGV